MFKKVDGRRVFSVDSIPTIITSIHGNTAKGMIVNYRDFSLKNCFLAEGNGLIAHGDTLKEAIQALQNKIIARMSITERIDEFCKHFRPNTKYKGQEFFDWHNRLTGSCLPGRESVMQKYGLSYESEYTIEDFLRVSQGEYGSEIVNQLKNHINENA